MKKAQFARGEKRETAISIMRQVGVTAKTDPASDIAIKAVNKINERLFGGTETTYTNANSYYNFIKREGLLSGAAKKAAGKAKVKKAKKSAPKAKKKAAPKAKKPAVTQPPAVAAA